MFSLVVRSIVCSTCPYRGVDTSAGQLACHHNYQGMLPYEGLSASATACRVRLSVECASSRDGQDLVTPIVITPLSSAIHHYCPPLPFSNSTCSLLLRSIFFPSWPHKRLFKNDLFSSASQVIFTDTSTPPPQFSSWRQSLDTHLPSGYDPRAPSGCEPRPLIYTSSGTTERPPDEFVQFYNNFEENSPHFQVRRKFFKNQDQLQYISFHQVISLVFQVMGFDLDLHIDWHHGAACS